MLNKKFSALMMLLIVVTASLVGITNIYKPADVQAQVQPKQLRPNAGQALNQQQSPPAGAQQRQQQLERPVQGALERQQSTLQTAMQSIQDKQLAQRILPYIIKGIDGKTLLQKIDAKTLAAKVLPYLEISANVITRDGPTANLKRTNPIIGATGSSPLSSTAKCNDYEIAVGGGFRFNSDPEESYVSQNIHTQPNGWYAASQMKASGNLQATVTCLMINVGLKNVQQPQPPSPPPGGPPLQPPPGLR
jgi:hypothetical protein